MYDLYKHRKLRNVLIKLLLLPLAVVFPYGLYDDFRANGFSVYTVIYAVMSALFIFIAVGLASANIDPYEKIKKLKQESPALVEEMEADFGCAAEYGHRIYKGRQFYFFRGEDFFALPIGGFTSVRVKEHYRKNIGRVSRCSFASPIGTAEVDIPYAVQSEDETLRLLGTMAFESRIIVERKR